MFDRDKLDCWVVNLASRPDRLQHATEQFAKVGLPFQRFEAYTPDQWAGPESDVARMRARTPGAIGCMMSQMAVIEKAIGTDRIVGVFEDDVCLCDDLQKRLEYIEEHLTWDWDVFYLGATFHVPGEWYKHPDCASWHGLGKDVACTDNPRIMRCPGIWGTYAYFVNGNHVCKVLDTLSKIRADSDGIDHAFIRLGTALNTFCFVPGCAWQYDNQSNIGNGITQFSHFKTLGPYVWTDNMEDFDPTQFDWNP